MTETRSRVATFKQFYRLAVFGQDTTGTVATAKFSVTVPFKVDHISSSMLFMIPQNYVSGATIAAVDPCVELFCPELNATLALGGPGVWTGEEITQFNTLKSFTGETYTFNFMSTDVYSLYGGSNANGTVLSGAGGTMGLVPYVVPVGVNVTTFLVRITFFGSKDMPI